MAVGMKTPLSVVRGAKALLVERGWAKHVFQGADGCLCVVAALNVAAGHPPFGDVDSRLDLALQGARQAVRTAAEVAGYNGLTEWNDEPERSEAEVMGALDAAGALLEGTN